jgi:hypothetical protein
VFHCPALPYVGRGVPGGRSYSLYSESKSTAAGFVLEAVKRRQGCYKRVVVGTTRTPTRVYQEGTSMGCTTRHANLCNRSVESTHALLHRMDVLNLPLTGDSPPTSIRAEPPVFATSAMAGGAEAHSHIAPPKFYPQDLFGGRFLSLVGYSERSSIGSVQPSSLTA